MVLIFTFIFMTFDTHVYCIDDKKAHLKRVLRA